MSTSQSSKRTQPTTTQQQQLDAALSAIAAIRDEIGARYLESSSKLDILLTCLIAQQHCLLLGPAGEGKSGIVDAVSARVTGMRPYKTLVHKTTTVDEIMGIPAIQQLKEGRFVRMTRNRLPEAHVAFIDEIFKSNSTLLNSMLMLMNERQYEQDGALLDAPLLMMVGASNELPQSDDLGALWDRFTLRTWVQPLSHAARRQFVADEMSRRQLQAQGHDTSGKSGTTITLAQLDALHTASLAVVIPEHVREAYFEIESAMESAALAIPSTRRLGWIWGLVAAYALLNGRTTATEDDLIILQHALWQDKQTITKIATIVMQIAAPILAKAQRIYDGALGEVLAAKTALAAVATNLQQQRMQSSGQTSAQQQPSQPAQQTQQQPTVMDRAKAQQKVMDARAALTDADHDLMSLYHEAVGAGRDPRDIQRLAHDLRVQKDELTALADQINRPKW